MGQKNIEQLVSANPPTFFEDPYLDVIAATDHVELDHAIRQEIDSFYYLKELREFHNNQVNDTWDRVLGFGEQVRDANAKKASWLQEQQLRCLKHGLIPTAAMLEDSLLATEEAQKAPEILGMDRDFADQLAFDQAKLEMVEATLSRQKIVYRTAKGVEKSRKSLSRPLRIAFVGAGMMLAAGLGLGYAYADQEANSVIRASQTVEASDRILKTSAGVLSSLGATGVVLAGRSSPRNRFSRWRAKRKLAKHDVSD